MSGLSIVTPILEVHRLCKTFGRHGGLGFGLRDVSFDVPAGRTVAVVGESGAGKSTVGRLVLRLMEPDSGTIRLAGDDFLRLSGKALRSTRSRVQAVFQDPYGSFDPHMSIADSIGEPLRIQTDRSARQRRQQVMELLDEVGMSGTVAERRPYELSGGQLQRCAIARAIATKPDLIVCDEAVAALDASTTAQVLNLLMDLQDDHGMAYLFISHDIAVVQVIADRVVVMKEGLVVEEGPAEQVLDAPADPYTATLLDAVPVPDPVVQRARIDAKAGIADAPDDSPAIEPREKQIPTER